MTVSLMKFAIFLLAAIIVVPIAKWLRLGSVLGYLVAGVILGPYMMGYLGVGDGRALMHISEFGVVMMLFLIGMELKPSFLWRLRVPILGMGGAQMLITTIALAGLGILFAQLWHSALVIGMILALSSTAIVVQTMSEKNLLATRAGRASFSVLLFQDMAVIPILAVMPLLAVRPVRDIADGEELYAVHAWLINQQDYVQFLAVLIAIIAVIVVGRFAATQLFRLIAKMGMRDIFTAAALFLVISVALLMESVGLSAALGSFLAGVVLSESEYRHEIELSIAPFKELLLGMFFISVGASLDIQLLMSSPGTLLGLALLFITVKWVLLYGLARIFRLNNRASLLFACLMAQGGEFAFVLFGVADNQRILTSGMTTTLKLLVTLSMMATPLVILLFDILDRRHQLEQNDNDSEVPDDFQEHPEVIIAGYGRFNQIIGRLLKVNGHSVTILDNNPQVISLLKRFGQKVFYGDATRPDLLYAAGADKAKVLMIGLKDKEQIDVLIGVARKHFPNLKIVVRAFDRVHAYHLMDLKIDHFQREQLNSALELGEKVLVELGSHPYSAKRQARIFKAHDEKMLLALYPIWTENPHADGEQKPGDKYISHTQELNAAFEEVLRNDRYNHKLAIEHDHAWEPIPTEAFYDEQEEDEKADSDSGKIKPESSASADDQAEQCEDDVIEKMADGLGTNLTAAGKPAVTLSSKTSTQSLADKKFS
ncbi:MAG: potassium transporter [Cardiobacteriales bacterium]|nr:MAG: potassium transporter [Cardiobacteriales bacterium]